MTCNNTNNESNNNQQKQRRHIKLVVLRCQREPHAGDAPLYRILDTDAASMRALHKGRAVLVCADDGMHAWYYRGKRHSSNDAPAVIRPDGTCEWYRNGKRHRRCGPAVVRANNEVEYWLRGEPLLSERLQRWCIVEK